MQKTTLYKLLFSALLAVSIPGLQGCSRTAASLDKLEERDPILKRAQARKSAQDMAGAIDLYNKALERKPHLARAHLELGLLYDEQEDYIRAIYHYTRYLELRPQTEKKKLIEDLIRHARISFAATLPDQPSGAIQEISILKQEIQSLREQLTQTTTVLRTTATAAAPAAGAEGKAAATAKTPVPKPEPAQPQVQSYTVQSGDTLSSIATKLYRDSNKWKLIYDANRATLSSPQSARVGQVLIIPKSKE